MRWPSRRRPSTPPPAAPLTTEGTPSTFLVTYVLCPACLTVVDTWEVVERPEVSTPPPDSEQEPSVVTHNDWTFGCGCKVTDPRHITRISVPMNTDIAEVHRLLRSARDRTPGD